MHNNTNDINSDVSYNITSTTCCFKLFRLTARTGLKGAISVSISISHAACVPPLRTAHVAPVQGLRAQGLRLGQGQGQGQAAQGRGHSHAAVEALEGSDCAHGQGQGRGQGQ